MNMSETAVLVFAFSHVVLLSACPEQCRCMKSEYNKFSVICTDAQLFKIPAGIGSRATLLNLSGNSLSTLENISFQRTLPELQVLDVADNNLQKIGSDVFGNDTEASKIQVLNVSNNFLSAVPRNLPSSLQFLKLSNNQISQLQMKDLFHMKKLKKLYLDFNRISEITVGKTESFIKEGKSVVYNDSTFDTLEVLTLKGNHIQNIDQSFLSCFQNLVYLVLSKNRIVHIGQQTFREFQKLKYLDLSENRISEVEANAFHGLYHLTFLSLAKNELNKLPKELPMLEWLDVSNNSISLISEEQKGDLYPQEVVLIGQNPFTCKCDMLWLKELYDTREYQLKFMNVDVEKFIPVCASPPHLEGDSWDMIGNEAFGCIPEILNRESSNQEEDNKLIWKINDLSIKVAEIGDVYIKLEWELVNVAHFSDTRNVIIFNIHPFGKKKQKKSISVHPQTGRYTLKALKPNTPYVICVVVMAAKSGNSKETENADDCLELITKELTVMYTWVYITINALFYISILVMSVLALCAGFRILDLSEVFPFLTREAEKKSEKTISYGSFTSKNS